jgi:hypothetical protein
LIAAAHGRAPLACRGAGCDRIVARALSRTGHASGTAVTCVCGRDVPGHVVRRAGVLIVESSVRQTPVLGSSRGVLPGVERRSVGAVMLGAAVAGATGTRGPRGGSDSKCKGAIPGPSGLHLTTADQLEVGSTAAQLSANPTTPEPIGHPTRRQSAQLRLRSPDIVLSSKTTARCAIEQAPEPPTPRTRVGSFRLPGA